MLLYSDDIINIKIFDSNKIEIAKKSYKKYFDLIHWTCELKYVKINSVNPVYLIISKANGYFEEINKSKYLTWVPTNKSKEIIKNHEKLWSKIRYSIRSIIKNLDNYDEKYMKIKFNSGDDLPLN